MLQLSHGFRWTTPVLPHHPGGQECRVSAPPSSVFEQRPSASTGGPSRSRTWTGRWLSQTFAQSLPCRPCKHTSLLLPRGCMQRSMRKNYKKSGATVLYSELPTITYCKIPWRKNISIINYATGPLETDPLLRRRPGSFKSPAQINCEKNPNNTNRISSLKKPCHQKLCDKL